MPVALKCLDDKDIERPSAHKLCESMEALRKCAEYCTSESMCPAETMYGTESNILQVQRCIKEKYDEELVQKEQFIEAMQEEIRKLKENVQSLTCDKEENKCQQKQIVDENQKLKLVIAELESQFCEMCLQQKIADVKIKWSRESKAPCSMYRSCDAAVCADGVAFFRPAHTNKIYAFNYNTSGTAPQFSQLPDCPLNSCSMVMINNKLTVVGGHLPGSGCFNKLFTFKKSGNSGAWMEEFPPMPTKRRWTIALSTKTVLIVIGGARNGEFLKIVEVMDIATREWYTAANAPERLLSFSATVCGDKIYLLGGKIESFDLLSSRSVFTCSLSALIQSCCFKPVKQDTLVCRGPTSITLTRDGIWSRLADLPVESSTCVSFRGQLIAVGGERHSASSTNIYLYNSVTNSWNVASHMSVPRRACFAAVMDNRNLIVVGGHGYSTNEINSVEIATLLIP